MKNVLRKLDLLKLILAAIVFALLLGPWNIYIEASDHEDLIVSYLDSNDKMHVVAITENDEGVLVAEELYTRQFNNQTNFSPDGRYFARYQESDTGDITITKGEVLGDASSNVFLSDIIKYYGLGEISLYVTNRGEAVFHFEKPYGDSLIWLDDSDTDGTLDIVHSVDMPSHKCVVLDISDREFAAQCGANFYYVTEGEISEIPPYFGLSEPSFDPADIWQLQIVGFCGENICLTYYGQVYGLYLTIVTDKEFQVLEKPEIYGQPVWSEDGQLYHFGIGPNVANLYVIRNWESKLVAEDLITFDIFGDNIVYTTYDNGNSQEPKSDPLTGYLFVDGQKVEGVNDARVLVGVRKR